MFLRLDLLIIVFASASAFDIKVFNLNALGNSWFNDKPNRKSTKYDYQSILDQNTEYLKTNYPNSKIIEKLENLGSKIISIGNPARKKKERLEALCDYLKLTSFDIVHLQEIWYKKDYDFLRSCLSPKYFISKFDPECGGGNPQSVLQCSGLTTLSKHAPVFETWVDLPKLDLGNLSNADASAMIKTAQFGATRKALIHIVNIQNIRVGLINTHLAPSLAKNDQTRELRGQQAALVAEQSEKLECDLIILGMDMNDEQWTPAYRAFYDKGFQDLFHPKFNFPITFDDPNNNQNVIKRAPKTLDYIMIKWLKKDLKVAIKKMGVENLVTKKGNNLSEHEALSATIEIRE